MTATVPPLFPTTRSNPFDPPLELTRCLREEPVRRLRWSDGEVGWLITSYTVGRAVLGDARFGKQSSGCTFPLEHVGAHPASAAEQDPALRAFAAGDFLRMDPPQHTRFRRLLASYFTTRAMRQLRADVEEIVERQLQVMTTAGAPVDLVQTFAAPIPLLTIGHMLGIPDADLHLFGREHTGDPEHDSDGADGPGDAVDSFQAGVELIRVLVSHKLAHPADDLLGSLAASGELSEDELVGVGYILAVTGQTPGGMLAQGVFALLQDPRRWRLLASDPSCVDRATEELLRYLTPSQQDAHTRRAIEDVEVGGTWIRAGERVHVSLPAANRDPARFDDPDSLDLARDARGHLTFAHGIHVCLGQHLTRLEIHCALAGLLRRFPGLRLAVAVSEVPMPAGDSIIYSPCSLPVAW